jgi:hypothetical protein
MVLMILMIAEIKKIKRSQLEALDRKEKKKPKIKRLFQFYVQTCFLADGTWWWVLEEYLTTNSPALQVP